MEPIAFADAARAVGAEVFGELRGHFNRVCTDTREGAGGSLFFALRGESHDGHRFVEQAARDGALATVVDHRLVSVAIPQLVVRDTTAAYGDLAGRYRQKFSIPVIAVTGSVGKTSTKEMIAQAIGGSLRLLAGEKNFNNEIGVPRALFGLDRGHEAAVLEFGMRGAGQIARLAEIAAPTIGVITNIGLSHIELLGSRDAIAAAKAELLERLPPDGTAVIPADDDYAGFLRSRSRCAVITFGAGPDADVRGRNPRFSDSGETRFEVEDISFAIPAPGVHHFVNALAACAVARALGIPLTEVAARLRAFRPPEMRMEAAPGRDGITLLNDAYNAAPDSMRAALQTLAQIAGERRRRVAILGDMKELGAESPAAHAEVGRMAADAGVSLLVTVGDQAREIARAAIESGGGMEVHAFADTEAAATAAPSLVLPGDIVLIKGSRAMEMERIVRALEA